MFNPATTEIAGTINTSCKKHVYTELHFTIVRSLITDKYRNIDLYARSLPHYRNKFKTTWKN